MIYVYNKIRGETIFHVSQVTSPSWTFNFKNTKYKLSCNMLKFVSDFKIKIQYKIELSLFSAQHMKNEHVSSSHCSHEYENISKGPRALEHYKIVWILINLSSIIRFKIHTIAPWQYRNQTRHLYEQSRHLKKKKKSTFGFVILESRKSQNGHWERNAKQIGVR